MIIKFFKILWFYCSELRILSLSTLLTETVFRKKGFVKHKAMCKQPKNFFYFSVKSCSIVTIYVEPSGHNGGYV